MIRKLGIDDFEKWKKLRLEAVSLHPASFGESYQGIKKQDTEWFKKSLDNGDIFASFKSDSMVGLIGVFSMQPENMRHRAVLFGLYVNAEHRNKNVASSLIDCVVNYVRPTHKQLHLTVTTDNEPAIFLYKKHGFIIYGTQPNALLVNDSYHDKRAFGCVP